MLDASPAHPLRCPRLAALRYDAAARIHALAEQNLKPALSATFWAALAERLATAAAYAPSWKQRYLRDRARDCAVRAATTGRRERNAAVLADAYAILLAEAA